MPTMKSKKFRKLKPVAVEQKSVSTPMTLGDVFNKIMPSQEETLEKILIALIDKENVEMKTDIQEPRNITRIETIADTYEARGFPKIARMLHEFVHKYRINRVSYNRGSRIEMRDMISAGLKREESIGDKLEKST